MARLKTVYMPVQDMDRARAFYEGALGLTLAFADGRRWVQFQTESGAGMALSSVQETARGRATPLPSSKWTI